MSHCSAGWTRSSRRAFLWSPAGYYFFSNHFTILREGTVCAQSPPINLLTLTPAHSLTNPMLPYPPLTHWAALRRCDRCLVAKIIVILALVVNALRKGDTHKEASTFSLCLQTTTNLCAGTSARVRSRIFCLIARGRDPVRPIGPEGVPLHRGVLCAWGLHCVLYRMYGECKEA